MPLSCDCDWDDDFEWWYSVANDYSILNTNRRQRCWSCKKLIDLGAVVLSFDRWRRTQTDIEERIYGDEYPLATKYHCERCADIALSITELGFCWQADEDQRELLKQYQEFQKTGDMPEY